MERYFDAFLYLANWGTRLVMIRLPSSLLDLIGAINQPLLRRRLVGDREGRIVAIA